VRGAYVERAPSERITLSAAINRYLAEVTPTKKPTTQRAEKVRAETLHTHFGKYALVAINAEMVATGFYPVNADTSKKADDRQKGVSCPSEESSARSLSARRSA
jgi:hypothetical protein